ncbi:hypothetical protein AAFF_G00066580 [Aldrovandia affinis]|uniref:Uncharacterized protein n=1 Tax=Aldrovandia affinis TaxID=143900 RepID=A0AAD7WYV7_9TELE|nr:hypothetical protein AAFF_G00066580 [Aldrovandia affinis]
MADVRPGARDSDAVLLRLFPFTHWTLFPPEGWAELKSGLSGNTRAPPPPAQRNVGRPKAYSSPHGNGFAHFAWAAINPSQPSHCRAQQCHPCANQLFLAVCPAVQSPTTPTPHASQLSLAVPCRPHPQTPVPGTLLPTAGPNGETGPDKMSGEISRCKRAVHMKRRPFELSPQHIIIITRDGGLEIRARARRRHAG